MSCVICNLRREKRFCPAIHGRICPQCCGEQREVTLDCPSQCPYLQQARQHEKPRAAGDLDSVSLFLQVEVSDHFTYQHEHLLMGLTYSLAKVSGVDRTLHDRDLSSALALMCGAYERRVNSGLYFDEPTATPVQLAIVKQIEEMIHQYRQAEQAELGHSRLREDDVLKALVFVLRLSYIRSSGRPRSRAFIDFLRAQFPEKESSVVAPQDASSRIIVP